MMPKSMSFKAGGGVSFEQLNETPGALTYLARNGTPSHPFAFTVSGSGAMPRDTQAESQGNDNAACDRRQCSGERHSSRGRPWRAHRYARSPG